MKLPWRLIAWLGTLVLGLVLTAGAVSAATSVIYVRSGAAGDGAGTSWAAAYPTLTQALSQAASRATSNNAVEIWVATGVYYPTSGSDRTATFTIPGNTTVRGGFAGTEVTAAQRAATGNQTVLSGDLGSRDPQAVTASTSFSDLSTIKVQDGSVASELDNSYNVVCVIGVQSAGLDRLTITGGMANNPAVAGATIGSMIQPVVPTATSSNPTGYVSALDRSVTGAGLFVQSSSISVTNCVFARNTSLGEGGAVVSEQSYISITGTTFVRNYSGLVGGAYASQDDSPTFNDNILYGNHAVDLAGAVWVQNSSGSVAALTAENDTLLELGALANAQASATTGVTPLDPQQFNDTNLLKSLNTIQKQVRKLMESTADSADDAASDAEALITEDLTGAVRGLGGAYAVISLTVAAVNVGADIAILLGANPNDPFFKTWGEISADFATYCTPVGLVEYIYGLIEGDEPVNHNLIQLNNIVNDYHANHNLNSPSVFTGNQFTMNSTPGMGGAVATMRANVVLANSYFEQNEGDVGGAAIAGFSYNDLQVENCAILNNQSAGGHSAVSVASNCLLRLMGGTVMNNHSAVSGGRAVSTETGAVTLIVNTLLWGNSGGSGTTAVTSGADVFAARRQDLDANGQSAYDNAGDSHFAFIGVCTIFNSDVQSLVSLPLGSAYGGGTDPDGLDLQSGLPNTGEGIDPDAEASYTANFSREPSLIDGIYPSPYSPLIRAGYGDIYGWTQNNDILGDPRFAYTSNSYLVDVGAVQNTGAFPANGIIYVDANAHGANNGLSWADAFTTLPPAFALIASPGVQIWVAKGTYYPTTRGNATDSLPLQPGVSVIGGFVSGATSITQSDPVNNPTIVTGQAYGSTLLLSGTSIASSQSQWSNPRVLQGIHFTRSAGIGALLVTPAVVKNCTFDYNAGRGLLVQNTNPYAEGLTAQLLSSTFQNNAGGGAEVDTGNLSIEGCNFYGNTATTGAGLLVAINERGQTKIERSIFAQNSATAGPGGGFRFDGDTLLVAQSVFSGNSAQSDPAGYEYGSSPGGAGLYLQPVDGFYDIPQSTLINNIFYANRLTGAFPATSLERQNLGIPYYTSGGGYPVQKLAGNDIEGLSQLATPGDANGNIDYVPDFVNAAAYNFALNNDSMLLNRGVAYTSGTDPTVLDGTADIGAVENNSTATALAIDGTPVFTALQPTLTGRIFTLAAPAIGSAGSLQWQVERQDGLGWVSLANGTFVAGAATTQITFTNPPYTWTGDQFRLTFVDSSGNHRYTAAVAPNFPASFLFVSPGGAGTKDGTSWANAMSTIPAATAVAQMYTQVFIAAGSFAVQSNFLAPGVSAYGGFAGTETAASQRTTGHTTTLSMSTTGFYNGQNTYAPGSVFTTTGTATWPSPSTPVPTLIDGFTFVCSDYRANSVINVNQGNTVVSNDVFAFSGGSEGAVAVHQGTATVTGCSLTGGFNTMINVVGATTTIASCTFTNDGQYVRGIAFQMPVGAIYSQDGSAVTVTDSTFTDCLGADAGAIYTDQSGPDTPGTGTLLVERCRFLNCLGTLSGAVYVNAPRASRIGNSLFSNNSTTNEGGPADTDTGGAISVGAGAALTVAQCTLVGQATASNSAVVIDASAGNCTLINSVVWNNSTASYLFRGSVTNTNNCIQGAAYDPLIDPSSADFAPLDGSPLLNVGGTNPTVSGATDLEGHARCYSGRQADLGAVEFQGTPTAVAYVRTKPVSQQVYVGQPVTFTLDASLGSNVGSTPIVWQYLSGGSWQPVSNLSGWTTAVTSGVGTLTNSNPPLSANGQQFRAQFQNYPTLNLVFTLSVIPRIVLYVNSQATPGGNGLTWATAFTTIGQAIAAASQYTDIWVETGTYNETNLTTPAGANLFLGFNGTETSAIQANPAANPVLVGSTLASRTLVVADVATLFSPLTLQSGQTARWQVNTGSGWVDVAAGPDISFATANGVPSITITGDLSMPAYQYRVVISQNGSDITSSVPATITVINRPQVYVDAQVSGGAHTGVDWADAFPDLGSALAAYPAYADCFVAQGTYTVNASTSFFLRRSLTLTGGYVAGTSTRDPVAHRTILVSTGGSTSQSITMSAQTDRGTIDSQTVVDGFVFQSTRYALNLQSVSPIIRNCRFEGVGTAIVAKGSDLAIDTCTFANGLYSQIQADISGALAITHGDFEANGGGANTIGSAVMLGDDTGANSSALSLAVTDTRFNGNLGQAAVVAWNGSTVTIDRCGFTGNIGGAEIGPGSVRNSLFADNTGNPVLGLGGTDTVAFCTIADNTAYGPPISFGPGGGALVDSIVWNNTVPGHGQVYGPLSTYYYGTQPTIARDIILNVSSYIPTSAVVPFDPLFVNESGGNFNLQPDSPAIGIGAAADLVSGQTDLAGTSRSLAATPSLGAYEPASITAPVDSFGLPAALSGPVGGNFTLAYTTPAGDSVAWQYSTDGVNWITIGRTLPGISQVVISYSGIALNGLQTSANGLELRAVLTAGSTTFTSPAVPVTVQGFQTLYVDGSVAASGNGQSWASAYKTLSEALAAADALHRIIEVAAGTYHPNVAAPDAGTFHLTGFQVYGGYPAGGAGTRNPAANPTVFTATAGTAVTMADAAPIPTLLDGVTVQSSATGIAVSGGSPALNHLIIQGNSSTGLVINGSPAVTDSLIANNTGANGGGIAVLTGVPNFERDVISGNTATGNGGGALIQSTSGLPTFNSVLIAGNNAASGGGVYVAAGAGETLNQVTIASNQAQQGGAITMNGNGQTALNDCIVWGNQATSGGTDPELSTANSITYNYALRHTIVGVTSLKTGVLRYNPVFVAPQAASSAPTIAGNYQLGAASPAIDAGVNTVVTGQTEDLSDNARIVGSAVDLGAYEYTGAGGAPLVISVQPSNLTYQRSGTNDTLSVAATNATAVQWQYEPPGTSSFVSLTGVTGFTGVTTNTLTISGASPALNGAQFQAVLTALDGSTTTTTPVTLTVYEPQYYVNMGRSGTDAGDGLSWSTAFRSLGSVVALPFDPEGTTVWVAAGTYAVPAGSTLTFRPGLSMYGGFAGTETSLTQRSVATNVTTIAAAPASNPPVITVAAAAGTLPVTVDGVTVTGTSNAWCDGLDDLSGVTLVLNQDTFSLLSVGAHVTAPATITASAFTQNTQALVAAGSTLSVTGTTFLSNSYSGGPVTVAVAANQGTIFDSCLFAVNYGPALSVNGATLRNLTIASNAGGPGLIASGTVNLYNSIIWGNRVWSFYLNFNAQVSGGLASSAGNAIEGINLSASPFVAAVPENPSMVVGNYQLATTSGLIDSGVNGDANTAGLDVAGQPRLAGVLVDPGAYEYQGDPYALSSPTFTMATNGAPARFGITTVAPVAAYAWQESRDGTNWSALAGGGAYAGVATSSLAVTGDATFAGRQYRVQLTFASGTSLTSGAATLVYGAVTEQPAGSNTAAVLTVAATGTPTSYVWQQSVSGGAFANLTDSATFSGSTTSSLTVALGSAAAAGQYRALVSYAASAANPTNEVAYAQAVVTAQPSGVGSQGSLSYGSTAFGFTLTGGIETNTLTDQSLAVYSALTGRLTLADLTTPVVSGSSVNLGFRSVLPAGDRVSVTVTSALRRADGVGATAQVWQFRNGTSSGPGRFEPAAAVTAAGTGNTAVAVADVDGNGTVDAIVAGPNGNQVFLNDGHGNYTASGAPFGAPNAQQIVVGGLTGAGAIDAVVVNRDGTIGIWTNNGAGAFTLGQTLAETAQAVAIGDLNGDGAQDLFVARASGDQVYFNDGTANFSSAGSAFGGTAGTSVVLGDVNGDGMLDALVGGSSGSELWINAGNGTFTRAATYAAADQVDLGDFDGDGRVDLVLTRANTSAQVWHNLGGNQFYQVGSSLGGGPATLATGDVDGDGKVDVLLSDATGAIGVWAGPSANTFTRLPNQPALAFGAHVALVDVDGDGALDLLGLDSSGALAVSVYHVTATVVTEWTPTGTAGAITATGLTHGGGAATAYVRIASLPSFGSLKTAGGATVQIGDVYSLSAAATLTFVPAAYHNGEDSFTWNVSTTDAVSFGAAAIAYYLYVIPVVTDIVANPDSFSVVEGQTATTLTGGATSVLANDVDNNQGDALTATLVQRPVHGTVTLNPDGTFTYVQDNSEVQSDQFTYRATDAAVGRSADAVVSITVVDVNHAPTAIALTASGNTIYTGQPAGIVVGGLTGADQDPGDAAQLTFSLVSGAGSDNNAEFTLNGASLVTAAPLPVAEGLTRTIRVRATDTGGLYCEQAITIQLTQQPLATAANLSVSEDSILPITLQGTGGAAPLTYSLVGQPMDGSLSGSGAAYTYQNGPYNRMADSFTFTVSDGVLTSAPATVTIAIVPVNHAPTLAATSLPNTTDQTPVSVVLQGSDPDGDTVQYVVETQGKYGQASISGTTLTYVPYLNVLSATAVDYLTVYAYDGHNGVSNPVTISVQVTPVPQTPVMTVLSQGYSTTRGQALTFPVSLTEIDGTPTLAVGTAPQNGTVSFDGSGNVIYRPNAGFFGTDTFTIYGTNGQLSSTPETITVVVSDPQPNASAATATGNENGGQIVTYLNGYDANGDTLAPTIVTQPSNGTISFYRLSAASWVLDYSPNFNFYGTDSLTYTMTDSVGVASAPATVTFTVTQVILVPTATPPTAYSGSGLILTVPLTLGGSDPQGLPLTYRIVTQPTQGTLSGTGPTVTYTLNAAYVGTDSFTYVVNNGLVDSAPATVTLTFVNNHPGPVVQSVLETAYRGLNSTWSVLSGASDPWGNPMFISGVTQGAHGTVTTNETTVTYQHNGDSATSDQFTFTVSDFSGTTTTANVFVTIADRTLTVDTPGDSGDGTLRAAFTAINAAAFQKVAPAYTATPDWTVHVVPYAGANGLSYNYDLATAGEVDPTLGSSALYLKDGNVSITGQGGPIVVDLAAGAPAMRLLHVSGGTLSVSGVSFTGGTAHLGGSIYNAGVLNLQNGKISGGTAQSLDGNPGLGGGIYESGHGSSIPISLTLTNMTVSGNTADQGGGLYNFSGTVSIAGGAFTANVATTGGGIYNTGTPFAGQITASGGAAFSGNGTGGDVVDAGSLPLPSTFTADSSVTMQNPVAPFVGVVPDTTVVTHFTSPVPVVLQQGQSVGFYMTSLAPSTSSLTGDEATRTLTVEFNGSDSPGTYLGTLTASNGTGGEFIRTVNLTISPSANRPPVANDTYVTVAPNGEVPIQALALANVVDPEGQSTATYAFNTSGTTSNSNSGVLYQDQGIWYYYAYSGGTTDSFTYTTNDGVVGNVYITVASLTQSPSTEADAGAGSLRALVENANLNGEQAWTLQPTGLPDSAITLSTADETDPLLGLSAFVISGNVTIDGSQQSGGLTIGVDSSATPMRVFHVLPGATLTLENLTVQGGAALQGGAIFNEGTVVLNNVILQQNIATGLVNGVPASGGAIYNSGGTLTVSQSTLQANTATMNGRTGTALGGAIFVHNGTVAVTGSTLTGNTADDAGAMFVNGDNATATVTLLDSRLGGSSQNSDLNESAINNGHVLISRTNTTISALAGPWLSNLADCAIGATGQLSFFANNNLSGAALTATAENQNVMPNSGLTVAAQGSGYVLNLVGNVSGVTKVHLVASSGNVQFQDVFTVTSSTAVAQPPAASAASASIFPLQSTTIDALANDSDPNGLTYSITAVSTPAHGTAAIVSGNLVYTETDASFQGGVDTFTYTLTNSAGASATATVSITVQATVVTVTNITDFNSAIATIETNTGANNSNPGADLAAPTPGVPWTIKIDGSAAGQNWQPGHYSNDGEYYTGWLIHGNVTIDASNAAGFTLSVPPGGYSGPPMRIFTVYPSASLTLKSLTLSGASPSSFNGVGKGGAVRNLGTFIASEVAFSNNTVSAGLAYGGGLYNDAGVATLTDCAFTSNSATGFGGGIASHNGTLTLNGVTFSGNTAPTANDVYLYGDDATATLHVIASAVTGFASATINGGSLAVTGLVAATPYTINRYGTGAVAIAVNTLINASVGSGITWVSADATSASGIPVTVTAGVLTYGSSGLNADDTFTYRIRDPNGDIGTGTVTVHWIDQPPMARNATFSRTTGQTLSIPTATLLATATDPDGDAISFTSADANSAQGATITLSGGALLYDPGSDGITTDDTFSYTIRDSHGATATATVTIHTTAGVTITPVVTSAVQNGATVVSVLGAPTTTYTITVSSDLSTWTTLGTVTTNALGQGTINDSTLPGEATGRYYRAAY